jgi:hypothetical protein
MIIFNYIYVCVYKVFKIISNKYVFDAPETYAIGFLTIVYFASYLIIMNWFLFDTEFYKSQLGVIIDSILLISFFIVQLIYYLRKENYKNIENKIRGNAFLGSLIMILWMGMIAIYISNYWKVG